MKANSKRKVFGDAVDLLMGDMEEVTMPRGVQMLPVKSIQPFHDHPFHLYEGERLEDMIASVKEHGVLNPVIVQKLDTGYEMLSGHNRWNAAKLAGLKEIPAIVKTDLSEEEAYVYVIETNLMQRSFSDLAISEKAAVLKARYEKGSCQGKRNDILNEIARLEGKSSDVTSGHCDQKLTTRDAIGKEYELSGSSVGRLLKLNDLIKPFKDMVDRGALYTKVVAPLRVARNTWSDEIHKWNHLKHLRYSIVLGSAAERKKALEADADIYIINRENLQWLIEQSGVNFFWDMVVLDELSSFKNWNSKRFKAFMKVRPKVKRVIGLTGTPSSNGLMDLFAEFKCLDMGERLGRFISQYRVNYFVPDRMNGPIVYSYKLRNGAEEQIYEKISDITISMKALDHLQMPELISNEYPVYMNDEEAKLYADMEEDLFIPLKKGEITAANAAALSGKLLQMANGAVYSDDGDEIVIHDQKLDALEDMIEAANGRSVMVAYWFKHDLSRIMRRLTEKKIPFEKLDSEESIRKWNRGELPVALIHPASAGHGLNLQSGGNTLIWFGLTWSLELYQQTVARLWRQGQTAETVVVQHIITAGTIDEDIMKALASKDMTQNRLIAAVKARVTHGR